MGHPARHRLARAAAYAAVTVAFAAGIAGATRTRLTGSFAATRSRRAGESACGRASTCSSGRPCAFARVRLAGRDSTRAAGTSGGPPRARGLAPLPDCEQ